MSNEVIISKSADVMRRTEAELGYTIGLGVLQPYKEDGIVLAAVDGTTGFSFHLEVGFEFPLHTGAPGKAMLAYLPGAERERYSAAMKFKVYTPCTISCLEDFTEELESVREKGYALDVSEQLEGCHCVGVPVFDSERQVVAGLWATGPASQLPVRNFEPVAGILRKAAQEIGTRISASSRSSNRDYILNVVTQAQEMIRCNLHRPLNMEELAANLYVGYSWFRRNFKEQTGLAPAEYHQQLRIEEAKGLLKRPELSVKQVSEMLGFPNQNHFSALFKRLTQHSPSAYRKKNEG
ncbi:IclR family transcriptional regulator C-terminal domain-containing protein [Pontiellaceae bacterium B12227]|nr:IclR family transcriptional regulator C-terminal domain-containing protein [Pontiellaceae bacterium B12227]